MGRSVVGIMGSSSGPARRRRHSPPPRRRCDHQLIATHDCVPEGNCRYTLHDGGVGISGAMQREDVGFCLFYDYGAVVFVNVSAVQQSVVLGLMKSLECGKVLQLQLRCRS